MAHGEGSYTYLTQEGRTKKEMKESQTHGGEENGDERRNATYIYKVNLLTGDAQNDSEEVHRGETFHCKWMRGYKGKRVGKNRSASRDGGISRRKEGWLKIESREGKPAKTASETKVKKSDAGQIKRTPNPYHLYGKSGSLVRFSLSGEIGQPERTSKEETEREQPITSSRQACETGAHHPWARPSPQSLGVREEPKCRGRAKTCERRLKTALGEFRNDWTEEKLFKINCETQR